MIVLDTHAWIWWLAAPHELSKTAAEAIERATNSAAIYVSAISAWEMSMLVKKGRLELTMDAADWIAAAESLPYLHRVPVTSQIAIMSVELEDYAYTDPADRIIIATAMMMNARLVTKDGKISSYPHVKTLW